MKYTNSQSAIYMGLMYKWSQSAFGFTIFRRARLHRARTANTERYSVFCILVNSFLHATGSGITFILFATYLFKEQMWFLLLLAL